MYIQLIIDLLIFIGCVYILYRIFFKEERQRRIETKKLLKQEKLRKLKEKANDMKEEIDITEDIIDVNDDVHKLNKELKKLDSKIKEE